jgi:uncharacterized phosphosugar-binding protein
MILDRYFEEIDKLYTKVKTTQKENIIKAGKMIAESVENGGAVHICDSGHIINSELVERGGGLMLYKRFEYKLDVTNPVRPRDDADKNKSMEGLAKYALRASNVLPGDVMILGSVSGKSLNMVDMAIEAKKMGVKLIVLTSVGYSSEVESEHSSGKRLFELGDVVLDNCAPAGEAMMYVEEMDQNICAASGLSAAFIMWSVTTVVIEELLEKGITPSVFKSHNYPGGPEFNLELREKYKNTGF